MSNKSLDSCIHAIQSNEHYLIHAIQSGGALVQFFLFSGGRLFERGAYSIEGANSNKYGMYLLSILCALVTHSISTFA